MSNCHKWILDPQSTLKECMYIREKLILKFWPLPVSIPQNVLKPIPMQIPQNTLMPIPMQIP